MERIKAYFEEQIKTDPALAEAYKEEKLDKCWKYIISQAKSHAKNGCAMIEDAVVYKWARDFMLGDVPEAKEEKIETGAPAEDNNSVTSEESVVKESLTTDLSEDDEITEITPDLHFESGENRSCNVCGYYIKGKCISKDKPTKASDSCSDFAKKATQEDVKRLVIEKVEQEQAEEIKPVVKKEKKSKQDDEYDGPSLFDFDDLF